MKWAKAIVDRLKSNPDALVLVYQGKEYRAQVLLELFYQLESTLEDLGIKDNRVVALIGDGSPTSLMALLVLLEKNCIIALFNNASLPQLEEFSRIAGVETTITEQEGRLSVSEQVPLQSSPMIQTLKDKDRPGLIFFSSGSSGTPKAILHDFSTFLERYNTCNETVNCFIGFLAFDHIGGLNSILFAFHSPGSTLVIPESRNVDHICSLIEKYRISVLPTSPSFLRLLLLFQGIEKYDLSSLRLITYGTEPMPQSVLDQIIQRYPHIRFKQTYGLSEVGILPTKSVNNNSLWMKIGGPDYQVRVIDDILEIKSKTSMLGYLNAPSPFTEDGWFITGDLVEQNADTFKILGRDSEIINVGGMKVYPSEVENHILKLEGIEDVMVYGEPHLLLGQVVCAKVKTLSDMSLQDIRKQITQSLADKVQRFMIPQKITLSDEDLVNSRFKKQRR